ncbi:PASTA domain-containing protein [Mollicutes bacterium LVI A0078]|nr:PASTA domain-containing protein [Mollicutes bacterium LVI A0075]WOO91120.1 PASTA domain-containing protein [Mollicutes bacterium LVI A0078]
MVDEQEVTSENPQGYIVSQSVEPGEMVGFGDTITIEVSKGPGEFVPNLVGYPLDQAEEFATDNNLTIDSEEEYSNSDSNYVIDQSLISGTVFYPEEDTMHVTISLGMPFVSDMTGGSEGEFALMINEFNKASAGLSYTVSKVGLSDEDKEAGLKSGMIKSQSISNEYTPIGSNIELVVYE